MFGKQHRYCPNCGKHLYDDCNIDCNAVKQLCCSKECRDGWERKYAASLLGRSAEEKINEADNLLAHGSNADYPK